MPRITAYKQLEYSDCGITCIRIIAKYYGKDIPHRVLRSLSDSSRIGISLSDIVNCTKTIGLDTASVLVNTEEIYRMPLPAILHWEQNHYVVLYKIDIKRKKFYIADPAQGKISFQDCDFFDYWKGNNKRGIALLLSPSQSFYEKKYQDTHRSKIGLWHLLKSSLLRYRASFLFVMLLTSIAVVADVALPMMKVLRIKILD